MRTLIFLILISCFVHASGQSFHAEAVIPSVEKDGFYRILLPPAINVHLNNELSDIRIFDAHQREVPYLLQKELPSYNANQFIEYEILEKAFKSGCCTSILLRNVNRTAINNIHLVIKNAEAFREASLRGSDDKKEWFTIKDHFILSAPDNSDGTQALEIMGFPWSNYEYYWLEIKDSLHAPLNILNAGYYEQQFSTGKYTELPVKIKTIDSASQKKTYVQVLCNAHQFVDKAEVMVSGAKYYRRNATLLEKRVRILKRGERKEYYRPVQRFVLTTGRTAIVELADVRSQEFMIEIENDDNPSLVIPTVKLYQLNRYLTAWLKKEAQYTVKLGQPSLAAPVYDLAFFKDSIPERINALEVGDIRLLEQVEAETPDIFFTNNTLIWVAIVAVMLVLGFMSVKLAREASDR
jgi:hypothetical protein